MTCRRWTRSCTGRSCSCATTTATRRILRSPSPLSTTTWAPTTRRAGSSPLGLPNRPHVEKANFRRNSRLVFASKLSQQLPSPNPCLIAFKHQARSLNRRCACLRTTKFGGSFVFIRSRTVCLSCVVCPDVQATLGCLSGRPSGKRLRLNPCLGSAFVVTRDITYGLASGFARKFSR